jgi:hypothetical protein
VLVSPRRRISANWLRIVHPSATSTERRNAGTPEPTSIPVIVDPRELEPQPVARWRVAAWWASYLAILAAATWLSVLAADWDPIACGAMVAMTLQLALLPWRR